MLTTLHAFSSLYAATLLMMLGSGLFNTYMGLRLTSQSVSEVWVGALIAGYYLGLVFGARLGHKLIIRVGHIRAFTACAAIATAMVLAQTLVDAIPVWMLFRIISGVAMVTQFMVLESWLHEQTPNEQRGQVFSFYMVVSNLGVVLGQLALTVFPGAIDLRPLILVGVCMVMCLVPIAITRRSHPPSPLPAPLDFKFFAGRVPLSLTVIFVAGNLSGAFYGLAPVFGTKAGLTTTEVALFVATGVAAGLVSQWPVGWLSDRINRPGLMRFNAIMLMLLSVLLWGLVDLPFWAMLVLSGLMGALQFTLYPLGAAFANDHVEHERRVGLAAVLLITYGLGACVGPLIAGGLMSLFGPHSYFMFISACAALLVWQVRPARVTNAHQVEEAPVHFVPMATSLESTAAVVVLDPRVDLEVDITMEGIVQPQDADTASVPEEGAVLAAQAAAAPYEPPEGSVETAAERVGAGEQTDAAIGADTDGFAGAVTGSGAGVVVGTDVVAGTDADAGGSDAVVVAGGEDTSMPREPEVPQTYAFPEAGGTAVEAAATGAPVVAGGLVQVETRRPLTGGNSPAAVVADAAAPLPTADSSLADGSLDSTTLANAAAEPIPDGPAALSPKPTKAP